MVLLISGLLFRTQTPTHLHHTGPKDGCKGPKPLSENLAVPSSTIPTKAPDHVPFSSWTWNGEAPFSRSLLRPGLGGDSMLGRGCAWILP